MEKEKVMVPTSSETMFQRAFECESQAREMKRRGDYYAERVLRIQAKCWLEDAIVCSEIGR